MFLDKPMVYLYILFLWKLLNYVKSGHSIGSVLVNSIDKVNINGPLVDNLEPGKSNSTNIITALHWIENISARQILSFYNYFKKKKKMLISCLWLSIVYTVPLPVQNNNQALLFHFSCYLDILLCVNIR